MSDTTAQNSLAAIIVRNEERRRAKGALPEQSYRVEYDSDHDEDGSCWAHWPAWLTSDPRFPSDAIANFTEVEIDDAIAEAIAFCCNDRPEDDITALARMLADAHTTIEAQRQAIETANAATCAAHERRIAFQEAAAQTLADSSAALTEALAILDEANAVGNLWPAQVERLAALRAEEGKTDE